jgi:CheY-like chemotaxis protein/DNA-binding XRE family transcriptional regulator
MCAQVPKKDKVPKPEVSLQARLGVAIRLHRHRQGITQEELAWRAEMHRTYVADIERGGRNVTLRSVGKLAGALKVTVADLLSGSRVAHVDEEPDDEPGRCDEILLVEDSAADAEMVVRSFKRARLSNPVKVVRDGAEALEYVNRTGRYLGHPAPLPQLVLLDLNLPKVSGIEVLRQIKANISTQGIPIVVLTSSPQDHTIIECGRLGAENYILKPVDFESFCRITSALNLQWTLGTGQPTAPPVPT